MKHNLQKCNPKRINELTWVLPWINHNTQTHIKESAIKHRKPFLQSVFFSQGDRPHLTSTCHYSVSCCVSYFIYKPNREHMTILQHSLHIHSFLTHNCVSITKAKWLMLFGEITLIYKISLFFTSRNEMCQFLCKLSCWTRKSQWKCFTGYGFRVIVSYLYYVGCVYL